MKNLKEQLAVCEIYNASSFGDYSKVYQVFVCEDDSVHIFDDDIEVVIFENIDRAKSKYLIY